MRSDVLLGLIGALSVLAGTSRPTLANAVFLGLLGGIAMNLKIHGAAYVLPMYVLLLCRMETNAIRVRLTLIAGLAGIVALALPFLPSTVSLPEYLHYVQLATGQPISRWMFEKNVVFAVLLLVPILWIYFFFRPNLPLGFA